MWPPPSRTLHVYPQPQDIFADGFLSIREGIYPRDERKGYSNGWYRAGGDVICPVCGFVYYDHPQHPDYEWLQLICTGNVVKL